MTLYETETETETAKMHYTSPRPRLRPLSLVRLETRRESRLCLVGVPDEMHVVNYCMHVDRYPYSFIEFLY